MSKYISLFFLAIAAFTSCIEDGVSSSAAHQPEFSTDTLNMGTIFTDQVSVTSRLTVYNRADKGIIISRIALTGENASCFRLNVDGFSGESFNDVEIRANDSIFVLVSATLPESGCNDPVTTTAALHFLTNGVDRSVTIAADGWDAVRLRGVTIASDTTLSAGKPYVVFDSLTVAPGATLTIEEGANIFFHQDSYLKVDGTLHALGSPGREVVMAGDRTGNVVGDISFDLMSRQWDGIFFGPTSGDSRMEYTHVCNTTYGVQLDATEAPADSKPSLTLVNSRLRNSGGNGLAVYHGRLEAYGCEIAEAAGAVVVLWGGNHVINHCTLANNYLFAVPSAPVLAFGHTSETDPGTYDGDAGQPYTEALVTNTIIHGMGSDISHGDLDNTRIYLHRCMLKSDGSDDEHFTSCLWDADPLFLTVRNDYFFDYRLKADSPAIGAADPAYVLPLSGADRYGLQRGPAPDLGAYVFDARAASGQ